MYYPEPIRKKMSPVKSYPESIRILCPLLGLLVSGVGRRGILVNVLGAVGSPSAPSSLGSLLMASPLIVQNLFARTPLEFGIIAFT
jgi:hypothetical protein